MLIEASMENYKLGALDKTEFEYPLEPFDEIFWVLGRSGSRSKKTGALNNHFGFATVLKILRASYLHHWKCGSNAGFYMNSYKKRFK